MKSKKKIVIFAISIVLALVIIPCLLWKVYSYGYLVGSVEGTLISRLNRINYGLEFIELLRNGEEHAIIEVSEYWLYEGVSTLDSIKDTVPFFLLSAFPGGKAELFESVFEEVYNYGSSENFVEY